MLRRLIVASLVCPVLAACSDSTGPDAKIWGDYDYAAAGFAGGVVNDSAVVLPYFLEGSFTLTADGGTFELLPDYDSPVDQTFQPTGEVTAVERNGMAVRFGFGRYYPHEGELSGRTISGTWSWECEPDADCFAYGGGTFTARRR